MAIGAVLWTGAEDWGDMVGEVTDRSRTMYGTSIPPQVCPSACLTACYQQSKTPTDRGCVAVRAQPRA